MCRWFFFSYMYRYCTIFSVYCSTFKVSVNNDIYVFVSTCYSGFLCFNSFKAYIFNSAIIFILCWHFDQQTFLSTHLMLLILCINHCDGFIPTTYQRHVYFHFVDCLCVLFLPLCFFTNCVSDFAISLYKIFVVVLSISK